MGLLSSFYIEKHTKFTKVMLKDIEKELKLHSRYVSGYSLTEDEIVINLSGGFESIALHSTKGLSREDVLPLMQCGYVPMADGTFYSGFKYRNGDSNVVAHIVMLLIKYYLRGKITIGSEDCENGFSSDFNKALTYLNNKGYDIKAMCREHSRSPYIQIKGKNVKNIYDEDGSIFGKMFKVGN